MQESYINIILQEQNGPKMGRPLKYDLDKISIDLIEWAKLPDSINFNKFCAINYINPRKLSEWSKKDEDFRETYEISKAYLAFRREEKLNDQTLNAQGYSLNATTYDFFLKEEKRDQAKFESDLKKQEAEAIVPLDKILRLEDKIIQLEAELLKEREKNATQSKAD